MKPASCAIHLNANVAGFPARPRGGLAARARRAGDGRRYPGARLKWSRSYAERAYAEVASAYDERGRLPDAHMDVFWSIEIASGSVKEAWPDAKLMDDRFIRSFAEWSS